MNEFLEQLKHRIAAKMDHVGTPIITRARHRESWKLALTSLERFSTNAPLELMCEELRIAAMAIGKITGKIAVDDLLDVIFSTFCIGK
jgi:tRNA modification GTPase